jgi:hypothetical protein
MMLLIYQPTYETYINIDSENTRLVYQSLRVLIGLLFILALPKVDSVNFTDYFKAVYSGQLNESDDIVLPVYSYKVCRSPIRSFILFSCLLATTQYNLSLIIFISALFIGLTLDSIFEESYYLKSSQYQTYASQVRNRFIPNVFNIFRNFKQKEY